jgi:hypothetical protein
MSNSPTKTLPEVPPPTAEEVRDAAAAERAAWRRLINARSHSIDSIGAAELIAALAARHHEACRLYTATLLAYSRTIPY